MSVKTSSPQVVSLLEDVSRKFGQVPQTKNAFSRLAESVENEISEHISETTLERVWGYSTRRCGAVSATSLSLLAKYVGFPSWDVYCDWLHNHRVRESEEFKTDFIDSSDLKMGACVKIGWMPDRVVTVRYLGDNRFEVLNSVNSSLTSGDTFSCLCFQKGRELYLDRFLRSGDASSDAARYVVGQRSGLTILEVM